MRSEVTDLVSELTATVGAEHVHETADGHTVAPSSTEEVAAVLRAASRSTTTVLPVGAGRTVGWLPAPAVDVRLELTRMDAILEHSAGDLVVHVQAGAQLDAVQAALAPHGQRLPISSPVPGVTVGGLVAADLSGPERYLHGTVRDLLIGTTTVAGDGTVAHAGGKVVKNVAGYDLGKLYTGSRGTLGVLTDVWFRLRPLPECRRWVTAEVPDTATAAAAIAAVRASQVAPSALQLHRTPQGRVTVGVELDGVAAGIDVRADTVRELIGPAASTVDSLPSGWNALPGGVVLLSLSYPPASLAAVLDALAAVDREHEINGSAGVGVLRVGCAAADASVLLAAARAVTAKQHGTTVVLRAPTDHELDVWGPQDAALVRLMRRVKDEFDPTHTLSPGRLLGGI